MKIRNLIVLLLLLLVQCAPIFGDRFSTAEEIVEFVKDGGDPNLSFERYRGNPKSMLRPLHWAVLRDDPDLVLFLLENGADPNGRDYNGRTPLMVVFGSLYEPREIDKVLTILAAKSDLTVADDFGDTVFELIDRYGDPVWKQRFIDAANSE